MLLRLLLFSSLLIPGFAAMQRPTTSQAKVAVFSSIDGRLLSKASVSLRHHNLAQVERWLAPRVRSTAVGTDGKTLNIVFKDGADAAILPSWPKQSPKQRYLPRVNEAATADAGQTSPPTALVLEPFATEEIGTHDADPEIKVLEANGYKVDQLSDQDVTINEIASFWKYNVVYIHTHAGVNSAGYSVFSTGQVANGDPAAEQQVKNGTVMVVSVSGLAQQYYGVLIPYIQQFEGQFPTNSMIYLDTCDLGRADPLWQAFAAKGVGAMITWDGHSIFRDETAAAQAFFAAMGQGDTIRSALDAVHNAGLDTSTWDGKVAKLGFFGDGYITLHGRAADAPTDTPVLTATATPTATSTATATPTATTKPTPLPLKVTLRNAVSPGQRQSITVSSSPNVAVSVRVNFPNGDVLTHQGSTDQAGQLQYRYTQRGSKIQYGERSAVVTINAGSGEVASLSTASYVIGFGRVDASVVPRTQQIGKPVTIWVHAAESKRISIAVEQQGKVVDRITGTTGARGWFHRKYQARISGAGKRSFTVRVRVSSPASGTSTSFTLR